SAAAAGRGGGAAARPDRDPAAARVVVVACLLFPFLFAGRDREGEEQRKDEVLGAQHMRSPDGGYVGAALFFPVGQPFFGPTRVCRVARATSSPPSSRSVTTTS